MSLSHVGQNTPVELQLVQTLPERHADLFSRHASPLQVCVFIAVDKKGQDIMSDEICRRRNRKQQLRIRGQSKNRTKAPKQGCS